MFVIINIVLIFILYNVNTFLDDQLFKLFNHFEVHLCMILLDIAYLIFIYFNSKKMGLKNLTFDLKKMNIFAIFTIIVKKIVEQAQSYFTLSLIGKESHHILSIV